MTANTASNTGAAPTRSTSTSPSMTTRQASDEALEAVKATGCPVVWTEDNGGHWIVGTYDLVADRVPRLGDVLVGAASSPAARRSPSPTAACRRACPRRATRRTGTGTGVRWP